MIDVKVLSADDYETITFNHDFQKDIMTKVLDIVKKYIQTNKLILVGGMAIDMAMRSQNSKLYKDNKLPDYDFYSTEHHKDAYRLGSILAKDFKGVSIINAFHASTMKIRVNFQEAADISYIPPSVFKLIPTINFQGFTVVHPHFQMIDQHRALSLPYEKPPTETVFGRWKKDIVRYDLLSESFPLFAEIPTNDPLIEYIIPYKLVNGQCLSGYPSLLYWVNKAKSQGFKCPELDWFSSFKDDGKNISCLLPSLASFSMLSDDYKKLGNSIECDAMCTKIIYNPTLDKIPSRVDIHKGDQTYTVINNYGNLRTAFDTGPYFVSNLQEVMCYLLTKGILYKDPLAINTYLVAKKLLLFACEKYKKGNGFDKYLPTDTVFGNYNTYDAFAISKENISAMVEKTQRTLVTPKNAYPTKENPTVKQTLYDFDLTTALLFQFDGNPVDSYITPIQH
jgi:hypothetical protein